MFGPPGILEKAAYGQFGNNIDKNYGLFPRGMITIFEKLKSERT